jgi:heme o synthase
MKSFVSISSTIDWMSRAGETVMQYGLLTKPRIILLVMVTGASAMVLQGSLVADPRRFAAVLAGIMLAAASANALNNFWDRDIDAIMKRTRGKRPIPAGKIGARGALYFGLTIGTVSLWVLLAAGNLLAAALGFGAIVYYVLIYTMWLKRRTPLNIVIGGASGAAAPLIGWAAGANELSAVPMLMFLVVFLWSPPHFWALALFTKQEYALARVPMLPVVAGDKRTRWQISVYLVLLLPATVCLGIRAELGVVFFVGTTLLGINFVRKLIALWIRQDDQSARALFNFSIVYLAALFALMLLLKW